jgi:hypothetical protein
LVAHAALTSRTGGGPSAGGGRRAHHAQVSAPAAEPLRSQPVSTTTATPAAAALRRCDRATEKEKNAQHENDRAAVPAVCAPLALPLDLAARVARLQIRADVDQRHDRAAAVAHRESPQRRELPPRPAGRPLARAGSPCSGSVARFDRCRRRGDAGAASATRIFIELAGAELSDR